MSTNKNEAGEYLLHDTKIAKLQEELDRLKRKKYRIKSSIDKVIKECPECGIIGINKKGEIEETFASFTKPMSKKLLTKMLYYHYMGQK